MQLVLTHLPHIIPAVVGMAFMGKFALAARRLPAADLSDQELAEWERAHAPRRRRGPRPAGRPSDQLHA
jgi:hypothetical protein